MTLLVQKKFKAVQSPHKVVAALFSAMFTVFCWLVSHLSVQQWLQLLIG